MSCRNPGGVRTPTRGYLWATSPSRTDEFRPMHHSVPLHTRGEPSAGSGLRLDAHLFPDTTGPTQPQNTLSMAADIEPIAHQSSSWPS